MIFINNKVKLKYSAADAKLQAEEEHSSSLRRSRRNFQTTSQELCIAEQKQITLREFLEVRVCHEVRSFLGHYCKGRHEPCIVCRGNDQLEGKI